MDAFCSVQDMIHAAIASYGVQASLREVRASRYAAGVAWPHCPVLPQSRGRPCPRLPRPAFWPDRAGRCMVLGGALSALSGGRCSSSSCHWERGFLVTVFGAAAQIYRACEKRGRIAYKRSGGSRFITHNDHWKSQIRHALYTGDRFVRCTPGGASLLPGARH